MTEHVIVTNLRERLAIVERDRDAARAEAERLRGLLRAACDGWDQQVITGDDGYYARANLREAGGLK